MATDVKVNIKQEGAQSFAQAFKDATSNVKALDSAVKLNSATMENSGEYLAAYQEKSKLLSEEIKKQSEVVKMAEEELARLTKEHGEGSEKVNNYQKTLNTANTKLEKLKTALADNEEAMDEYADSVEKAGRSVSELEADTNSLEKQIKEQQKELVSSEKELKNLSKEYGEDSKEVQEFREKIAASKENLQEMQKELKANREELKAYGNAAQETGDKISKFGKSVSDIGSKLNWLSVGASAALTGMFSSASDLEENINKVQVVFDDLSGSIEDWSKTTLDAYGIAQSTSLEMISLYGDMATSMGLTTEQAAQMGKELVGRAGDMASFKNVSLDVAQSGLAAIFTGQAESLKKFGIVMTEANLNAYALAQGFAKEYDEMTQAEQVMLRYQYVMDATKNAAGDFANTNDGAANSVRVAQEALKEASATLGEEVIPLVLPLIQDVTELIKGVNALDDGTKKLIVEGLAIVAVAGPILTIGGKIISGVGWLVGTGLPALKTAFGATEVAGTAAMTGVSAEITATTVAATSLLGVITAVAVAAVSAIAVFAKLRQEHKEYEQEVRKSELTAGMQQITESDRQYYNPEDLISVWNGSEFEHYAKAGSISDVGYAEKNAQANGWTTDGYGNVIEQTTNYNIDMNVANVSDLQNLLDIADTAQLLTRMG